MMGSKAILVLACASLLLQGAVGSSIFSSWFTAPKAEPRLGSYNVDPNSLTVSGISSGGAMSTQFHFIYSSEVKGAGIFAAGPYLCGYGGPADAAVCMATPGLQSVPWFIGEANILSSTNQIDKVGNVNGSKVYIFHGSEDSVVHPGAGKNLKQMYEHYGANIHAEFSIASGHGQPVKGNGHGGPCEKLNLNYNFINECGYNGAYEMFKWFYGNDIVEPDGGYKADGELLKYDQNEFFIVDPLVGSMARSGLIYVPKNCKDKTKTCRFHIAFHGCMANEHIVGNDFATKTQYMEVAELNDIIVLFPQTTSTLISPTACWDWFGYTGLTTFANKLGNQPVAVHKMMKRVMGL